MKRVTLELPDNVRSAIEILKSDTDSASITEVIRKSVSLLQVFIELKRAGGKLYAEMPDGKIREIILL